METIPAKRGITFSDALQQVGFGKFNVLLIVMGGIILANVVLEIGAVGFILPLVECDLKLSHTDKGLLSAISFVGVIMSSHLWGFLADTKGRRAVIMPTLLISSVVTFFASFSDRFWILLLLRFTTGFFTSAASATIFAYVGEFHVQRIRSRAIMTSSFTLSVAAILWPFIAWGVINQSWALPMPFLGIVYKPWRLFMVVFGVPGFVCAIALIFCPESPQFLLSVGKEREAIDVLKRMHKWNGGAQELEITELISDAETVVRDISKTSGTNFLTIFLRTMWQQTVPLFQTGFLKGTLVICMIQFLYHVAIHGFFVWFPYIVDAVMGFDEQAAANSTHICDKLYAKQRHSYEVDGRTHCAQMLDESTFIYTAVMEVLCTAEYAVILIIINRVRKVRITMAIFIACGACGLAAIHVPSPTVAIWLYALMLMASNVYHLLAGIVVELYPTHLRGMALCIALLVSRLGGVVGGNLSGLLLEYNCELAFSLSGSFLVLCGLLMLLIPRHLRPKKTEIELNS